MTANEARAQNVPADEGELIDVTPETDGRGR
jgi:hypothetical protein